MARVPPPARVRVVGTDSNSNSRRASRRWSHAFRPSTPAPEPALDVPVDDASPGDEHNEEEVDRVHEVQQPPHDSDSDSDSDSEGGADMFPRVRDRPRRRCCSALLAANTAIASDTPIAIPAQPQSQSQPQPQWNWRGISKLPGLSNSH
jgi:hypothetical protein